MAAAVLVLAGCGASRVDAPTITVVTSIYSLAQLVSAIGGTTVRVVDLSRPGVDPRTETLTPAQQTAVRDAAVVVDVGDGFQAPIEATARQAHRVVDLDATLGPGTFGPWLDPVAMEREAPVVADALAAANPKAASSYRSGQQDYTEQLTSMAINYQQDFSSCPNRVLAGPDATLTGVATQYRLRLIPVGTQVPPTAAAVGRRAAQITAAGIKTVFAEPWVPDATVRAVAGTAGAKVRTVDTLEAPPAGGWPKGSTYLSLLATNLSTMISGLGCTDVNSGD